MLTHIRKIKNFGVFDNYMAAAEFPAFGRYNVVYGENGSGKTTLSRLFACLEAGEHPDHPELEFTIESQSGQITNSTKYSRKLRVFNADYVEANLGRFDGPLRHILILGEENKAIAEELKVEITTRYGRIQGIEDNKAAIAKLESETGKLFSQIAKTIAEATSGLSIRSYRKPDAEASYAKLTNAKSLSTEELETHRATVRQEQMAPTGAPHVPSVQHNSGMTSVIQLAHGAADRAKHLATLTAQSATIARLAANHDIAEWVERGVNIHKAHKSNRCEFCQQTLSADRLEALADHFSVEDQKLKDAIESERGLVTIVVDGLDHFGLPDRMALYSELRNDYDAATERFTCELAALKTQVHNIDKALAEKLAKRTMAYDLDIDSDTAAVAASLAKLTAIAHRHDEKTAGFGREKQSARDAIEGHYLLTIKDQVDESRRKISNLQGENTLLYYGGDGLEDKRGVEELFLSINDKQAKVSSAHGGGANLTEHLAQFLGRTDLRFESAAEGYRVLRRGKPAKRLSEGEKNAIAFLYFLVHLKDQDFELAEGIVVVDDPISSLDASAIYQAFSFLKNDTQGAKQLFILTHNFEFLRLLINWLKSLPGPVTNKSYTMVRCMDTEYGRSALLAPLDKLLIEHATEYHHLFKVLYTFKSDGTILGCYHVPNIARKVLETFLDFHVPSSRSFYQKLEATDFDPHKKTAIYKFANDLSHHTGKSFDPALVAEAQKNTSYLLEMIKAVAPLHYQGLKTLSEV